MTYVVHGATGAQGGPVVAALAKAGKPVVAITRQGKELAGAKSLVADYTSVEQLVAAYQGAAGVFVHLPVGPEELRLQYARHIVAALTKARPARVVVSTSGMTALPLPEDSSLPTLLRGVREAGISQAVIAPRLFLENLLLPSVIEGVQKEGVLRYPLRADFPVSWASHLDIADVAVELLTRTEMSGTVAVGQYPPVTGPALAEAFAKRLAKPVKYEALTPSQFGQAIVPWLGEAATASVVGLYTAFASLAGNVIDPAESAQKSLELPPRTTRQWLDDIGL